MRIHTPLVQIPSSPRKYTSMPETLWTTTEFWSAILGAVAGGVIAFAVQMVALREGRKIRIDNQRQIQNVLANSILFKMMRIHSNFYGIHKHLEECYQAAENIGPHAEPWQFVLPIANLPEKMSFSADEMGMLLSAGDGYIFNSVLQMDMLHNSLVAAVAVLNLERRDLVSKIKGDNADGSKLSGILDKSQLPFLLPKMIEVNSLAEGVREQAKKDFDDSESTLWRLHKLLKEKFQLTYNLESVAPPIPRQPT